MSKNSIKTIPQAGDEIDLGDQDRGRIKQVLPSGAVMVSRDNGCRIFLEWDEGSSRWRHTVLPLSDPRDRVALGLDVPPREPPKVGDAVDIQFEARYFFDPEGDSEYISDLRLRAVVTDIDSAGLFNLGVQSFKLRVPQDKVALAFDGEPPRMGDATTIDLDIQIRFDREYNAECSPTLSLPAVVEGVDAEGFAVFRFPEFQLRALSNYFTGEGSLEARQWQWLELPNGDWI